MGRCRIRLAALMTVVVVAAGCASSGPAPEASRRAQPETVAPPPAVPEAVGPAPQAAASASPLCAPIQVDAEYSVRFPERGRQVMEALETHLQGISADAVPDAVTAVAPCLHAAKVVPKLFTVSMKLDYSQLRLALWQHEGAWHTASLSLTPFDNLYFDLVDETPEGIMALAIMRNRGSGHAGAYHVLRFAAEMTDVWQSKIYDQYREMLFDGTWVLGTYRDPVVYKEPHVLGGNCCLPTNGQTLWKWEGGALVEQASRHYPDPERTVSGFVAAWNRNQPDLLAPWVTDATALQALMDEARYPSAMEMGPAPQAGYWLIMLEAVYWDRLPPEFRGPQPSVTELLWPAKPKPLRLVRADDTWKVAGWGPLTGSGPSEVDTLLPASRLDPSAAGQGPYADLIHQKVDDARGRLGEPTRVVRSIEGSQILVYDRLGLALDTWGQEVMRLVQTAGQVAPGIRIGGDAAVVEQLPGVRVYETGRETIYTTHGSGIKYEVHVSSGQVVRVYVW